jgi:hypothetical protein
MNDPAVQGNTIVGRLRINDFIWILNAVNDGRTIKWTMDDWNVCHKSCALTAAAKDGQDVLIEFEANGMIAKFLTDIQVKVGKPINGKKVMEFQVYIP